MASLSNINGLFDVHSTGAILFSTSHGTSGQILRSNGNAAPTWVAASTVIGGPYLPLTGGTLSGATATATGISFTVGGVLTGTSATFTGLVSGITPTAAANFATKAYVDAQSQGDLTSITLGNGLTGTNLTGPIPNILMSGTYTGTFNITDDLNVTDSARFEGTTNPITIGDGFGYGGNATICKHNTDLYLQYNNGQAATNLQIGGGGTAVTIKDAQNSGFQITGNGVTYFTGGDVGISTTIPQSILSLSKTDEASYTPATAIDYSLMLGTRNGNAAGTSDDLGPGIIWKYNDSGGSYTKKSAGIMQVGEGNYLRSGLAFYTNDNADQTTAWSEKMRLSMDGNVGIGTTTPGVPLHVVRTTAGQVLRLQQTGSNIYTEMQFQTPTGNMYIFVNSSGYSSYGGANATNFYTSNGAFAFHSNVGNNHLYIANGGNIGIGTTSPFGSATNEGLNVDKGGHSSIMIGDGVNDGGMIQSSDNSRRIIIGANVYDSPTASWSRFNASGAALVDVYGEGTAPFISLNVDAGTTGYPTPRLFIKSNGNVGIGTNTPGTTLHVQTSAVAGLSHTYYGSLIVENSGECAIDIIGTSYSSIYFGDAAYPYSGGIVYNHSLNALDFRVNTNTNAMWIDSAGDVGIGVTGNIDYKLDVNGTGNFSSYLKLANAWNSGVLSANSFYVQNTTDGFAMGVGTGISSWFSWDNSAGQKRAIDVYNNGSSILVGAGGQNVQINGTTVPLAPLSVDNNAIRMGRDWAIANRADIRLDSNGPSNPADILYGHTAAANQGSWTGVYWALSSRGSSASNRFYFYRGGGNPTGGGEAVLMSFDPNLRVGINQEAPAYTLDVTGTARITSRLGIGTAPDTAAAGDVLKIQGGNNGLGCIKAISGQYSYAVRIEGSNLSTQLECYSSSTALTTQINFSNPGNSSAGKITTTGNSTAYNTLSDYRVKENVIPISDSISRLNKLKPSRFNFIGESNKTVDGFIAHEVQDIVPEAIVGEKDEIDKDGNPVHQGIDQAKLVPLLVAAIQELEARVKELENK